MMTLIECMPALGDLPFAKRSRSRTRCLLPDHNYGNNVWPFTEPRGISQTTLAVAATDPTDKGQLSKPFHFRANSVTIGPITADHVGLLLDKNGNLFASGRFTHDGGDGGLIGGHVGVKLRFYVAPTSASAPELTLVNQPPREGDEEQTTSADIATPNSVNRLPADAYMVLQAENRFWVSRGGPTTVNLLAPTSTAKIAHPLSVQFSKITHIEVELEYQKDR